MLKKSFVALVGIIGFGFSTGLAHAAPVPAFKLKTLEGRTLTDRSLRGKVVVLDFWATWCSPCRAVSKIMQKVHETYAKQGVQVICVDVKETGPSLAAVKRYIATHHYTYPFSVENASLDQTMNVTELPTVIVVDRKGGIQYRATGYHAESTANDIDAGIKKALSIR